MPTPSDALPREGAPARWLPEEPLPPYAYLPRQAPHPTRDTAGHSFGRAVPLLEPPDPPRWRECAAYLRGVDLFNHGYYWEAHEAWEALWHACGRTGTTADFLRALIRLAAAGFKLREGRPTGAVRHATAASALLRAVASAEGAPGASFMGLRPAALADAADRFRDELQGIAGRGAGEPAAAAGAAAQVRPGPSRPLAVLPIALEPGA